MPTEACGNSWFNNNWFDFGNDEDNVEENEDSTDSNNNDSTPWHQLLDWFNFGS